jgi:putative ABC transport system substrate-binding protein
MPWHKPVMPMVEQAARTLGVELRWKSAGSVEEFETALAEMKREGDDAVLTLQTPFVFLQRFRVAEIALRYRMPGILGWKDTAIAGGLLSYSPDILEMARRAAVYVDKILKGAKPADLPVEQASKYDLVINLKTARALGIEIPPAILARADEVIE